ncbi:MFS transporter [Actinoplanes awajinensis]|uniref:Major facilitator superfamily (MFS) profile domain-containing protein n=1 Tax=Actinoplanes awajinensis subsp. mycoplanecinus TaxID=135947 RepID=A0A117MP49_9ACTN|nr:MFS transporter [Actinoplanes awajinensis]KUL28031.1 hypothetical protein ADL15_33035 [Actinoplanes awajinensis subsp. mycoplanecinus]
MSSPPATAVVVAPPRRNEWILIAFTILTNLADAVMKIALPLLAVRLTDSPALVAAVAVLMTLPWLTTALHIGVLVDRWNRRNLMIGAEVTRIAAMAVLLVTVLTGTASLPLIYVVAFGLGVAEVIALTSAASIVPSAVPRARWQTVTARVTAMEYLCNGFLGAPLGGFLVAAGFALALGATGLVYVLGAVLLLLLAGQFAPGAGQERRSVGVEITDGLRFLWRTPLLRTMALLIAVMAGCWSAWLAIIPVYAVSGPLALSESQFGLLMTAMGAGGVVGTLLVGPVNRLLGRFNAASRLVGWGLTPVAALIAGVLAQTVGYRVAFGVFAAVCLCLVVPYLKVVTGAALTIADQR